MSMADDTFKHSLSDRVVIRVEPSVPANTEEQNSTLLEKQHPDLLPLAVQRLQRRVNWLSGLLVVFVVSNGILAVLVLNLRAQQQQQQQARQLSTLMTKQAEAVRQKALESQIILLSQQVNWLNFQRPKDLSSQLKATQNQLKELQTRLTDVQVNAAALKQVNEMLLKQLSNKNTTRKSSRPVKHRW